MDTERGLKGRKPRADGQRNRARLVAAAKEAFDESGAGASLDDIARKAGVGAGTLYRHFPSRETLWEGVYRAEVEKMVEAAGEFGRTLPPTEALRAWLFLFIEHLATKKIIAAALDDLVGASGVFDENKPKVGEAFASLFARAVQAGDIREGVNPLDFIRCIVGVTFFGVSDDWNATAVNLVDILISGSRPSP